MPLPQHRPRIDWQQVSDERDVADGVSSGHKKQGALAFSSVRILGGRFLQLAADASWGLELSGYCADAEEPAWSLRGRFYEQETQSFVQILCECTIVFDVLVCIGF